MKKLYRILLVLIGMLFFYSCSEDENVVQETRLFRPVLNNPLSAHNNTIAIDMAKMTKAVSYKVEISRDEAFAKIIGTLETPNNKIVITDLLWNTKYYIRATALAATPELNSKVSDLGNVTTERFPSIMQVPTESDVTDISAKAKWLNGAGSGDPITQVKVFTIEDEALTTPLATFPVSSQEQLAGAKVVTGLKPSTAYQIAIYSEEVIRGWNTFITKEPLPTGADVVDLRGIVPTATTLFDALTNAPAGATIILDGDATYPIGSTDYLFNKSLTIKSGYALNNTTGAIIDNTATSNSLELANNVNIDKIVFEGISFVGDASLARYVFRGTKAITSSVGELKFLNCKMTNYRDIIRTGTQWTSGTIAQFIMDGCVVTNVGSNAAVIVDGGANNPFPNLVFQNSTFSKVQKLVNNKSTSNSVSLTISDCTFAETPPNAGALLSYGSTTNITNPIVINNTIFGGAAVNVAYSFITSGHLKSTTITSNNTYVTNDIVFTPPTSSTPLPAFTVYPGSTTKLWIDPFNGNFNFKDSAFPGTKTCGDPRWRK
ncbi:DUF5123 domain-containing protein [Flavobacterium sp.]|uniref:DUF5123 domain-containing protein n=1 Tax=Flavobacterium sp. TaxID=239 RepID=UPI002CB28021|nr:DUF5123 domain-containing protein [Flavobacterium sp.]HSD06588.1 DUF5123 domain-containing protein [Flavobacterium sp.]